jgi:hypothetical protein
MSSVDDEGAQPGAGLACLMEGEAAKEPRPRPLGRDGGEGRGAVGNLRLMNLALWESAVDILGLTLFLVLVEGGDGL